MKIDNHRLVKSDGTPFTFTPTPNMGGKLEPKYLVMHFTAGSCAEESIQWLCKPSVKASAHLVIGRDGSITQLVPFDRVAWHAGPSSWDGIEGLNQHSIGVELDNAGRLLRQGDSWRAWFGVRFHNADVIEAIHKNESQLCGWETYTQEQIAAAIEVACVLVEHYRLRDVVGHDDIAPHRKCDPGPAFPMASFRAKVTGRSEDSSIEYETTTDVNIRKGPGCENQKLSESPLPPKTRVRLLSTQGNWCLVDVIDRNGAAMDIDGWVHGRYLSRVG